MKELNILFVVFLAIVLSACATKRVDMLAEGDVTIRLTSSDNNVFSKVDVYEYSGRNEIEIVMCPKEKVRYINVGAVNVLIKKTGGNKQLIKTDKGRIDKHRFGTKLQHAHFSFFHSSYLAWRHGFGDILRI